MREEVQKKKQQQQQPQQKDQQQQHNVGQFEVTASVDRAQVKAGDAVTWRVTLRGTGNLRNARLRQARPHRQLQALRPDGEENVQAGDVVRGEKSYTYLLMPERGGALSLPAVELPYFDPAFGKYAINERRRWPLPSRATRPR